jgi:putative protease
MELLAPAGNVEKLKYAYLFGADAAYIGISGYSLRARAENLSPDHWEEIRRIKGAGKLYGALNIYFFDRDIQDLREALDRWPEPPFDAFIVSDIGVAPLLRERFPSIALHLSTQANCINSEAAKLYRDMGFTRIVAGREMRLQDIEGLKCRTGIEVEVFVHGAMCLAYSGRCFLSRYMAERSANRGDCAHSCRWDYRVLEEAERPGQYYPVSEGENFTTILSSKDICMIDHLDRFRRAGVDALKIEGRMKSVYYTAIVTRAYRKMLDSLDGKTNEDPTPYRDEIFKVSHREFSTGFFFDRDEIEAPTEKSYLREYDFLGTIGPQVENGTFELNVKNQIRESDTLEYVGYDVLFMQDAGFILLDEDRFRIEKVDHGKKCYLKTSQPVKAGYLIRKRLSADETS